MYCWPKFIVNNIALFYFQIEMWLTNFASAHSAYVTKMKVGMSYQNRTFNAVKVISLLQNKEQQAKSRIVICLFSSALQSQ